MCTAAQQRSRALCASESLHASTCPFEAKDRCSVEGSGPFSAVAADDRTSYIVGVSTRYMYSLMNAGFE